MTSNNTLGYLKKRILDALDEYTLEADYVTDTNREILLSKMPDVISSSLLRMYKGLPIGISKAVLRINDTELIGYCNDLSGIQNLGFTFETKTKDIAVVAGCFGDGRIVFVNTLTKSESILEFQGGSEKRHIKAFISLPEEGEYSVTVENGTSVKDFSVYEKGIYTQTGIFSPKGFCSTALPDKFDSFCKIISGDCEIGTEHVYAENGFVYIPCSFCGNGDQINVVYKEKSPSVTGETADDYVFDLQNLEFEALINLCASELCREEETGLYTRLLYKYNDLSEGIFNLANKRKNRNTFYKNNHRRW